MTDVQGATQARVVSPTPERARLTIMNVDAQADVSLPLDVPVALLLRHLPGMLTRSRPDAPDEPSSTDAAPTVWTVNRAACGTQLDPSDTLRDAGVSTGDLLQLIAQRALVAPTHHDDVVDATARLNKVAHPGWGPLAARRLAFGGVCLISAAWVYLLSSDTTAPHRAAVLGMSTATALGLIGGATVAVRSFGKADVGIALGWAALPVAAAAAWTELTGLGGYGLAAGSAALVGVAWGVHRLTGVGHGGYVAAEVAFGICAVLLAAHTAGVPAIPLGAFVAVLAILSCSVVPGLLTRSMSSRRRPADADATSAPDLWAPLTTSRLIRAGLYGGQAAGACIAVSVVLLASNGTSWAAYVFALTCSAALGLQGYRAVSAFERAMLWVPATGLVLISCALAVKSGARLIPLVAFAVLLGLGTASAAIGIHTDATRRQHHLHTMFAYARYLVSAGLIPLALWVVGVFDRLGIS